MSEQNMEAYFQQLADDAAKRGGLSGKGAYFRPGIYALTLKRAFQKTGQKGLSHIFYIFEYRVDQAIAASDDETPNAVGSTVSHVLKPSDNSNFGLVSKDNLLKIGAAFANVTDEEFMTPEGRQKVGKMLTALVHPSNPCRGMAVRAEAFNSETKAGEDRVYIKYMHDPASLDQTETAKRRAAIDAGQ